MSRVRGWLETLRAVFRARAMERDMEQEFRFHLESEVERRIADGMTPAEARAAAHRKFGGTDVHAEAVRDARGARFLSDLRSDVRYAFRALRRTPVVAVTAVLTLALGIGSSIAIFSVVNGVLLRPLPYPEAERLVSVWGRFLPESGFDFPQFSLSAPEYFDYAAGASTMEAVAAYAPAGFTLLPEGGEAVRVSGAASTANLFDVLGVRPQYGRAFTAAEASPDGERVAIISHGLWNTAFGGDAGVVGRQVTVNGQPTTIIGIMPQGFSYPDEDRTMWVPLRLNPADPGNRQSHNLVAVGRLRADATLDAAHAEMSAMMSRWRVDYPEIHTGHFLFLRPLVDDVVGDVRQPLLLVLAGVGVILLLVSLNIAHVLLARGVSRHREIAVRAALGAPRRRLIQQLLAESGLLALAGTGLGLLGATLAVQPILALGRGSIPRATSIGVDANVAVFAVLLAVMVTLLTGIWPALRAGRVQPQMSLREEGRGGTSGIGATRARAALVVGEVALATLIVLAAGLLTRSFRDLTAVDPGFDPDGVLIADIAVPLADYPDAASLVAFFTGMQQRMGALPGVQSATATSTLPLYGGMSNTDFEIENRPVHTPGEPALNGILASAMPGLPETLGVSVLEGRFFTASDDAAAPPVVVINRALARTFFRDENPLGRRLRVSGDDFPWLTVVGVIEDIRFAALDEAARPAYILPFAQLELTFGRPSTRYTFALRTQGDPLALAPAIRDLVRTTDARLPVIRMDEYRNIVSESVARPRFTLSLFGGFAILALLLGAIGLYGVLACAVAERTRELGIRMALGAQRFGVARMVVAHGLVLAGFGLLLGFVASLATGRLLSGMLFGVTPTDPLTYVAVAATLLAVAFLACIVPAARALRTDPMSALRA